MQNIIDLWKTTTGKLAILEGGGIAGLLSLCFVCAICGTLFGDGDNEQVANVQIPPTNTPAPSLSFADIVQHPDEKGWTNTQYSTYFDTIKGQSISGWSGTILEIDEYAGEPYLSLDMKSGEPEIDAYVYIKEDDILKVGIGQNIVFAGTIDSKWSEPNGFNALQIKDVTLLELGEIPTQTPIPTNTPEPTATPVPLTDTPIPEPTSTAPIETPILEVGSPIVTASENDINIRSGPDTNYDVIGTLPIGESLEIIGRNADSSWWQVSTPNGIGWIFANVATASNVNDTIPIVESSSPHVPPTATEVSPQPTPVPTEPPASTGPTFTNEEVDPPWWPCAQGQIKANNNSGKYHSPDGQFYAKTYEDVQCFNTAAEADAAGFVASKR